MLLDRLEAGEEDRVGRSRARQRNAEALVTRSLEVLDRGHHCRAVLPLLQTRTLVRGLGSIDRVRLLSFSYV